MFFDRNQNRAAHITMIRQQEWACRCYGDYEAAVAYQRAADSWEFSDEEAPYWMGLDRWITTSSDPGDYLFEWHVNRSITVALTKDRAARLVGTLMAHYGWDQAQLQNDQISFLGKE